MNADIKTPREAKCGPISYKGIDVQMARRLLRYEPDTGKLFWRSRSPEFFRATKARTSEHACRNWNAHYAGKEAFTCLSPSGYRQGAILNNSLQAHRVIWAIVFGESPVAQIDHINGDRSDNRLKNLRAVSIQQNRRNMRRPRRNTSGCLGVSRNPGSSTWRARIKVNGKEVHLGSFKTKSEAAAARKAADRLHGYHPNHGRPQ